MDLYWTINELNQEIDVVDGRLNWSESTPDFEINYDMGDVAQAFLMHEFFDASIYWMSVDLFFTCSQYWRIIKNSILTPKPY